MAVQFDDLATAFWHVMWQDTRNYPRKMKKRCRAFLLALALENNR